MDFKLLGATWLTVFFAELGDKTQLAAFALSASNQNRWAVFLGASLALVASTALAVGSAHLLEGRIPLVWVRRSAGALFILMGVAILVGTKSR